MVAVTGRRPRVLAVDDDAGVLDVLHLLLDDRYDVVAAPDGESALRCLLSEPVDLVLLDVVMEGLDGITLLQQMRRGGVDVPVMMVSAINTAWTAAAAMRLGAVDYITKPFACRPACARPRWAPRRPGPRSCPGRWYCVTSSRRSAGS